ncbi:MAG: hypothetical protein ACYC5S_08305 [Thiobacillus sp.]
MFRIAVGVSANTGTAFFDEPVRNMTAALGADAGFIARIRADDASSATTAVACIEGELIENFEYTPFGRRASSPGRGNRPRGTRLSGLPRRSVQPTSAGAAVRDPGVLRTAARKRKGACL